MSSQNIKHKYLDFRHLFVLDETSHKRKDDETSHKRKTNKDNFLLDK